MRDELDFRNLHEIHDCEHDVLFRARKRALPVQERHAAADFRQYGFCDLLSTVGYDEDRLAPLEARNDFVSNRTVHIHADEREHRRCHAEQERRDAHEHTVERENHTAHAQRIILLHDGAEDIEASCTAIHAKDEPITDAVEYAAEDCCEHIVIDRCIRIEKACRIQASGKNPCTDDNIDGIAMSHETPRSE